MKAYLPYGPPLGVGGRRGLGKTESSARNDNTWTGFRDRRGGALYGEYGVRSTQKQNLLKAGERVGCALLLLLLTSYNTQVARGSERDKREGNTARYQETPQVRLAV